MLTASFSTYLLKVGDKVVVHVDPTQDDVRRYEFWKDIPPNEVKGTIVSFERRTEVAGFGELSRFGSGPGIFSYDNVPIVQWDGLDHAITTSGGYLALEDQEEWAHRRHAEAAAHGGMSYRLRKQIEGQYCALVRVAPLPHDILVKGDKVDLSAHFAHAEHGIVHGVGYREHIDHREGKISGGIYYDIDIVESGRNCGMTMEWHKDAVLIERGKVWQHYCGGGATFDSVREEAEFQSSIFESEEIRNPESGVFGWTREQAEQAVRDGEGDIIYEREQLDNRVHRIVVHRYHDPEFGLKVRKETTSGMASTPSL